MNVSAMSRRNATPRVPQPRVLVRVRVRLDPDDGARCAGQHVGPVALAAGEIDDVHPAHARGDPLVDDEVAPVPVVLLRDVRQRALPVQRQRRDARRLIALDEIHGRRTVASREMGQHETVFTMEATPIKFGPGSVADAGWELKRLGVTRAMLCSDPGVVATGITDSVVESIRAEGIEVDVFTDIRVEPSDESFQVAADAAVAGDYDGFVGVGGGSSLDTAKVADLIATHGGEIIDYVNAPVGGGRKPPAPAQAAARHPDDRGHRVGGDDGRDPRHPEPAREERHLAPLPAPGPGHRRPRADPLLRPARHRLRGAGRRLPRRRVLPRAAVRPPRRACDPGRPPALPGLQPDHRHLVGQGARVRRRVPAPRGRRQRRRRGARPDDARRDAGGDRVRGRRAATSRTRAPTGSRP